MWFHKWTVGTQITKYGEYFYDRFAYSLVIVIELLGHAIMDYYQGLERKS